MALPSPQHACSNPTDYLTFVRNLSSRPVDPSKSVDLGDEMNACSIGDAPVALPHLGPDLLQSIFKKLPPSPKDLAPLEAVCTEWKNLMNDVIWKELCFEHARGLCDELNYTASGSNSPPGGWKALYKMVVYCPGLHYPTFHHVLECHNLIEKYSWRDGLGHVESSPKGFCTGRQAVEGLHLLGELFKKDEVIMSCGMCSHAGAVEQCHIGPPMGQFGGLAMMMLGGFGRFVAPPLLACRGIVKDFGRNSRLARVTGATAYFAQLEASGEERLEELRRCPYCSAVTFPLSQEQFTSEYTDYDLLFDTPGPYAYDSDTNEGEPDSVLMTGFVCLNGHIVLAGAGYPPEPCGSERLIQNSGEKLKLERSVSVLYWSGHIPKEDSRFRDGLEFLQTLNLEQLVAAGSRLAALHRTWPASEKNGVRQLRSFTNKKWSDDVWENPMIVIKFMQTEIPGHLVEFLHSFLLRGEPGLTKCLELLSGEFAELDERSLSHWAKKDRETAIKKALKKSGFRLGLSQPEWPHPESVQRFIEGVEPISVKAVIAEQRRAQSSTQSLADRTRVVGAKETARTEHGEASGANTRRAEPLLREQLWDCGEPEELEGGVPLHASRGKVRMCALLLETTPCVNRAAKGCSGRGCGKCCASLPIDCELKKHKKAKAGRAR